MLRYYENWCTGLFWLKNSYFHDTIQRNEDMVMDKKSKVTVRIFGTDYILCGSESEEYINNVAFNVDKMMREISTNPLIKPLQIAVLTACNFCDEYLKSKDKKEEAENAKANYETLKNRYNGLSEENKFLKEEIAQLKDQVASLKIELARRR